LTIKHRTGGKSSSKGNSLEDGTKMNDFSTFLTTNVTKDNLTLYLTSVFVRKSNIPIAVISSHASVLTNLSSTTHDLLVNNIKHEDADLMILNYM